MKKQTLHLFSRLEKQREDLLKFLKTHSEDQLHFKPDPNSWNMLQVIRHLVTAESLSFRYIKRKMSDSAAIPEVTLGAKVRSLLLKFALKLPVKFKAPKVAEVNEEYPDFEMMIDEWNSVRYELKGLMIQADEEIFNKTIYKHPRAGYLTLHQTIHFMKDHIDHHIKQIERISVHPHFPK
ncbi:DinB family protein [Rhodohalobacter halophilus]|uniref:DinB family protein n=1 Tax=Rhodohalobacter halophilus TaxID=1812810 RepID=UPI00083FCE81|nr:DinB family protein [Rhodohalobacter halophilus]